MRRFSHLYIALSAVSCAFFPRFSFAFSALDSTDNSLEIIEVKGDFKKQPLDKIPSSVVVFSEDDIQQQNAQHMDDLLQQAANVNFSAGASRGRFLQVRGVGERSEFTDSINPSVGVLIDGIDYSVFGVSSLVDIEQVEVFRGPEATRFGANAMAGMLNVQSRRADFIQSGELFATYSNYDSWQLSAASGRPLTDKLAVRASVDHQRSDGFMENRFLKRDDTNGLLETTAKLAWRYLATPDLTVDWISHFRDLNNNYDAFSLDRNRTTWSDAPGQDKQRSKATALSANYQGFTFAELVSQLTFLHADTDYGFDEDWSFEGIHPDGYTTEDRYLRARTQWSAEQRLISQGQSAWVAGWYASGQDTDLERHLWDWEAWQAATFFSHFTRDTVALFGQWETKPLPQLEVTVGTRLERYQDDYHDSHQIFHQSNELMWGGKLNASYSLFERSSVYVLVSRGYKAGGVNGEALGKAKANGSEALTHYLRERASFAPESLLNAEFGLKTGAGDHSWFLRASAFSMWRKDMQVNSWVTREQMFIGFIDNAASGRNWGLELDGHVKVTSMWNLSGNFGLLMSEINGFLTEKGLNQSGRDQAHAPRYQYHISSEWLLNDAWSVHAGVQSKAAFYYSDSHNARSKEMQLLNLRLQWQHQAWQVALWSRNALNESYGVRGFYFGNDPRDGYQDHTYEQLGEPRRVGLTVRYQF